MTATNNHKNQIAYLAPLGFEKLLIKELKHVKHIYDRLILSEGPVQKVYWAQNIWLNPLVIPITSINHAASCLKAIQRNWWPFEYNYFRRMKLIQEKLPHVSGKALDFLAPIPNKPLGSYTLIDENTLLASSNCSSPMPNGEWHFNEDKINPPSRAYLKLWEFFTRFNIYPKKTDICLDLGASPGGWTWVLSKLASQVIAYDKSSLDNSLLKLNKIKYISQDAFKIKLEDYSHVSWVFSDIICYPEKLFDFINNLLKKFPDKKYVFTIKFKGDDNANIISLFSSLPGEIIHLSNNKHELTWFKL